MKTYNFKAANWVIFALTLFFLFMGGAILLAFTLIQGVNIIILILSFVGLLFFSIFMIKLTSFARVEATIDDDTVSIKWLEQFLFSNKQDIAISFNEIVAYIDQSDSNWDWLKIEMKNGDIYKIWHSNFLINDDYSEFISAFASAVNYHNIGTKSSVKDKLTTIKRAKSIYESTGGFFLAGFAIIIIVGLPILLIVFPPAKEPNYFLFVLGYVGAIYFLYQIYIRRKKNKTNDKC